MTDRRYQRDLNSLVRRKHRQGLNPAKPRAPVTGGQGFAGFGVSPCEQVDVVYGVGWDSNSIHKCDPTNGELYLWASFDGAFITVYRDKFYNGFEDVARLNGSKILTGTLDGISGLSCNNEELFISDNIASPAGYRLRVYDHATLTLQRTLENFVPTSTSPLPTSIACGPTHYAVAQRGIGAASDRFLIYDNDDNLVVHVTGLDIYTGSSNVPVAIDGNRAYFIDTDGVTGDPRNVHIYDLLGNKITEWTIPYAFVNLVYGLEITVGGIWFSSNNTATPTTGIFTYYEKGGSPDTFSAVRQEFAYTVGNLIGISRNRCDSLFV